MKITAGTFFLNPLALDYPIVEWVESVLGFCDEVILVDMGSSDSTCQVLSSRFGEKIKIIKEPWQFSKTYHEGIPRNVILRTASNPWVYLTDSDEFLHEKYHDKVESLTEQKDWDIFRFPTITYYGSCYVICKREKRSKMALIRKEKGFYFGPLNDKGTSAADTLKLYSKAARKVAKWKDSGMCLVDYGRCRFPEARMRSVDFFVKQDQARRGLEPVGMTNSVPGGMGNKKEDYIIPYPDLSCGDYEVRKDAHPKVLLSWIRKHWKSHGWEV